MSINKEKIRTTFYPNLIIKNDMITLETIEYQQIMNDIKYPKPKCKTPYCDKDTRAFNDGFCYSCGNKKLLLNNQKQ